MLVIAAQESELKPLREAYEATQTALQLERQIAAEAVERTANLDEECAALRQQLTHLSTVRHWPWHVLRHTRCAPLSSRYLSPPISDALTRSAP
jgi:hypothetical protein